MTACPSWTSIQFDYTKCSKTQAFSRTFFEQCAVIFCRIFCKVLQSILVHYAVQTLRRGNLKKKYFMKGLKKKQLSCLLIKVNDSIRLLFVWKLSEIDRTIAYYRNASFKLMCIYKILTNFRSDPEFKNNTFLLNNNMHMTCICIFARGRKPVLCEHNHWRGHLLHGPVQPRGGEYSLSQVYLLCKSSITQ